MRQFLFTRRPLARSTLLTCHLLLQLGLVIGAALWLVPRTPWAAPVAWVSVWPTLALGVGAWLLTAIGLRLLAELWLLPYHLSNLRPGFTPGAVITRSFERRPAVHDEDDSWTSEARPVDTDTGVVGSARVRRPAERLRPQAANHEPTLDLSDTDSLDKTSNGEPRS
jgi:hypothetical protein